MLQRKDSNQPEQGLSKHSCVSTILLSVSLCHLICILSTIRLVMTATVQFNILFVLWGPIDFHSQYVMPSKPLPLYCPLNSQTVNVKASYSLLLFICSITTTMKVVIKLSNLLTLLLFFPLPIPGALSFLIQVILYSPPSQQHLIMLLDCMSLVAVFTIPNFSTVFKLPNNYTLFCS